MKQITNQALTQLQAGNLSLGVGIRISHSTAIARTMAAAEFDWLFIDLEHGSLGIESCAQLATAALDAGIAPLVRVPPGQHWLATRALESGALGIVMPDVRSAAEAQALVDVTKFRPIGQRNIGGPSVHTAYRPRPPAETAELFNSTTLTVVMVETPQAMAVVDDIAAVDGVDVVMIGGNDLSTTMEIPGQTDHPDFVAAFEALTTACKKHGKWSGMGGVGNNEHVQKYIGMGVQFILGGADTALLANGARKRTTELRQLKE